PTAWVSGVRWGAIGTVLLGWGPYKSDLIKPPLCGWRCDIRHRIRPRTRRKRAIGSLKGMGRGDGVLPKCPSGYVFGVALIFLQWSAKVLPIKVLPVQLPRQSMPAGVVTLKGRTISPIAKLFIEQAREIGKAFARAA